MGNIAIENPDKAGSSVRVRIDDLTPDQKYELGDVVLSRQ